MAQSLGRNQRAIAPWLATGHTGIWLLRQQGLTSEQILLPDRVGLSHFGLER